MNDGKISEVQEKVLNHIVYQCFPRYRDISYIFEDGVVFVYVEGKLLDDLVGEDCESILVEMYARINRYLNMVLRGE